MPKGLELFDYQVQAIDQWERRDFQGIFDMATGTGKTLTGLGAVVRLFEKKQRCFLLIVCPYQHLVEQWVEDIERFNIKPIIGYSSSPQRDWKKRLKDSVNYFNANIIDFKCLVTTNRSFISKDVRDVLKYLREDVLLLVDEAHNFGSKRLKETLNPNYRYRLGLSATLERHNDTIGTQTLFNYFGEKCIEYGIERAIKEGKLTKYYYHPRVVYLTDAELIEYHTLSKKIAKAIIRDRFGKVELSEHAKTLLVMRARVVAGAFNKVSLLKDIMLSEGYVHDTHMLVYCGSATMDNGSTDENEQRQITAVCRVLGNDLGMKVTKFTSEETAKDRENIKRGFITAEPYQAIVAIKCLDEGVNIPSIKTAFILASTTNPKEYIQRRGRVLRKSPNKEYSVIWDFITLPRELSTVDTDSEDTKYDVSLVKREIARMEEFGRIAENPSEMDTLKSSLIETYGLNRFKLSEEDIL
jgi:superfamily II DNA or RNA helicase